MSEGTCLNAGAVHGRVGEDTAYDLLVRSDLIKPCFFRLLTSSFMEGVRAAASSCGMTACVQCQCGEWRRAKRQSSVQLVCLLLVIG